MHPNYVCSSPGGGRSTQGAIISSEVLAVAGAGYCRIVEAADLAQGVPNLRGGRGEAGQQDGCHEEERHRCGRARRSTALTSSASHRGEDKLYAVWHTYIHTFIPTYIHKCKHTCIQYIHTYSIYIHTLMCRMEGFGITLVDTNTHFISY